MKNPPDTKPARSMPEFFPGFATHRIETATGVTIHARSAGGGAPVLLLHGYPQSGATWNAVAPRLAAARRVVVADLRGYGDSGKPDSTPDHAPYSKRAMAADMVAVMRALGHERFAVVGHDRGGRVAHRMALDHPGAVARLAVLDIAPTLTMYDRTDFAFAQAYFHWFFLTQPAPLPERLIEAQAAFFLDCQLRRQSRTEGVPVAAVAAEYLRCYTAPGAIHAMCEDYRAAAGIDLEHDRADDAAGHRIAAPLLALWGSKGTVGALYDVLQTWRDKAASPGLVTGTALPCGHLLQEEQPDAVLARLMPFLDT